MRAPLPPNLQRSVSYRNLATRYNTHAGGDHRTTTLCPDKKRSKKLHFSCRVCKGQEHEWHGSCRGRGGLLRGLRLTALHAPCQTSPKPPLLPPLPVHACNAESEEEKKEGGADCGPGWQAGSAGRQVSRTSRMLGPRLRQQRIGRSSNSRIASLEGPMTGLHAIRSNHACMLAPAPS